MCTYVRAVLVVDRSNSRRINSDVDGEAAIAVKSVIVAVRMDVGLFFEILSKG